MEKTTTGITDNTKLERTDTTSDMRNRYNRYSDLQTEQIQTHSRQVDYIQAVRMEIK